ncbi:oxidoreductase (plasmid) [Deinococcus aetherius]|uniref:Oxidoreductase n=1 Tax=Deinococcus aetherius TaxID=200252 RepID=A0ABM8AIB7_9DEIO|nr:aldo/keto reductase [Deinococcus aetherius]BDP43503.1 oxidoreductase [Deinococcus aetherius]
MRDQAIPGTDLRPSVIALGTVALGSTLDEAASLRLLGRFLDLGGTFLDTARVYSDWLPGERSRSEKMLGRWLATPGTRDRVVLATKGGHPPLEDMRRGRLSRQDLRLDVEGSLRDLRTDRIDLYWLHRDDPTRPVADIVETLNDLADAGLIRALGASNWSAARLREANAYARRAGKRPFVANQMSWSLAEPNPGSLGDPTLVVMDEATRELHRETGLAAVPYSSQANGFFGGKYGRGRWWVASPSARHVRRVYYNGANFGRLERVREVAARLGCSPNQVALAALTAEPFPVFPIVGAYTLEQLEDSAGAGDLVLDEGTARYVKTGG